MQVNCHVKTPSGSLYRLTLGIINAMIVAIIISSHIKLCSNMINLLNFCVLKEI